jgi:hypothetical protein
VAPFRERQAGRDDDEQAHVARGGQWLTRFRLVGDGGRCCAPAAGATRDWCAGTASPRRIPPDPP